MATKARLPRTIKNVGYALISAVDNNTGKPTYGNVKWLVHNEAGGREYSAEPKGEVSSIYADGIEVYGEEMPHNLLHTQRYIKTEEYLRKHPQK